MLVRKRSDALCNDKNVDSSWPVLQPWPTALQLSQVLGLQLGCGQALDPEQLFVAQGIPAG